jgi:hypothetical protein
VTAGERSAHGTLISGALASQLDRVAGPLVPPSSEGVGTLVSGAWTGSETHCWVLRKRTGSRGHPLRVSHGGLIRLFRLIQDH